MARIATIAAAMALMVGQPVTAAWAQSADNSETAESSRRQDGGTEPFFRGPPERIIIALGALTAVALGLNAAFKGNHHSNNGPRPTSP
jgi:hypothetical protein